MAAPPSTKKVIADDLDDDWTSAKKQLLLPVNSFLSDVNDSLAGGLRLDSNLGCQVWTFRIQVPQEWAGVTLLNSWVVTSASFSVGYCYLSSGDVRIRGNVKSGVLGLPAFALPSIIWPSQDVNLAGESNGAFGKLVISSTGNVIPTFGSNVSFSLDCTYRPATPVVPQPSCFPLRTKCTLPGGQALKVELGAVLDITPGATPVAHQGSRAIWRNDSGYISIDNIPGLLPGRTYSVTAVAYPR